MKEKKVVLEERVIHTFYFDAETDEEALSMFEEANNNGKLDYSDGEVVDSKVYVEQKSVVAEIEHYNNDNDRTTEVKHFQSLEDLFEYMFFNAKLRTDPVSGDIKPHISFGIMEAHAKSIPMPISFETIPSFNGYQTHWIRTILDEKGTYIYSDGSLTAGVRKADQEVIQWVNENYDEYLQFDFGALGMTDEELAAQIKEM